MTHPLRPTLCCLLIASQLLSGCAIWQPTSLTPTTLTEAGSPDKVRITQTDGSTFVVHSPTILADTLSGEVDAKPRRIPLATVSEMAVQKFSFVATVMLGAALFVATLALQAHGSRGS
jgi:hypothetical protein